MFRISLYYICTGRKANLNLGNSYTWLKELVSILFLDVWAKWVGARCVIGTVPTGNVCTDVNMLYQLCYEILNLPRVLNDSVFLIFAIVYGEKSFNKFEQFSVCFLNFFCRRLYKIFSTAYGVTGLTLWWSWDRQTKDMKWTSLVPW